MKILSSGSSSPSARIVWALLASTAILGGGCHEEQGDGSCTDDVAPDQAAHVTAATQRGRVSVEAAVAYDGKGASATSNSIVSAFTDISQVETSSRTLYPIIYNCFGLTGVPTTSCRQGKTAPCQVDTLEVVKVEVEGFATGTTTLDRVSTGKYSKLDITGAFYGTGNLTAKVTGKTDKGYFPTYDQTLATPEPLELLAPDPLMEDSTRTDLRVEWKKGNGDYILIDVQADGTNDKIQCIAVDDGCQVISATLMDIFVGSPVKSGSTPKRYKLTLSRVKATQKSLDSNTSVLFSAVTKLEAYAVR
jgi:hypothetical protein